MECLLKVIFYRDKYCSGDHRTILLLLRSCLSLKFCLETLMGRFIPSSVSWLRSISQYILHIYNFAVKLKGLFSFLLRLLRLLSFFKLYCSMYIFFIQVFTTIYSYSRLTDCTTLLTHEIMVEQKPEENLNQNILIFMPLMEI
jgi:hypothetical protein